MPEVQEKVKAFLSQSQRLFIGGEWVNAVNGQIFSVYDPSTGKVVTEAAMGEAEDIDRAVRAARSAFESDAWRGLTPYERAQLLNRLADLVEENLMELAEMESIDSGKPIRDTTRIDLPMTIRHFRYYAGWVTKITGDTIPNSSKGNYFSYTLREPLGVVGQIIPWNFPILMAAWKLAAALACGNTVVLKPAEQTPLTALRMGELISEAGFPQGVVNIVTGFGETAGAALAAHSDVDKIAFTGSTQVGQSIMRAASGNLKKLSLELGGKSPNVIFNDADLKKAVRGAFNALYYNEGQFCSSGSRLFVERSVQDEVLAGLEDYIRKMKIGDSLDPETRQGPVVSKEHLEHIERYIRIGKEEGAKPLIEGVREKREGYFITPTLFSEVENEMRIAQEEIFGPVLAVLTFDDLDEVIEKCNRTMYGLASGVWTNNIKTAQRMIQRLQAGTVWVNCYNLMDDAMPFGGYRQSGFGREMGSYALDMYTQVKSVWIDYN